MSFGNPTAEDPRGDGTSRPLHPWFQDPVWQQWWTLQAFGDQSFSGSIKQLR